MDLYGWGRVLLALVVPIGWGLISAWAFDRVRRYREEKRRAAPPADGETAGGRPS